MNQQDALRYLMAERISENDSPSKRYGRFPIARANTAWNCAIQLSDGDEDKVTHEVLDEIMDAVEGGDNILEYLVSGQYTELMQSKASENSSGP